MDSHKPHHVKEDLKSHVSDAMKEFKGMKSQKLNIGNELKNVLEIIKLNKKAMIDVASRKTTFFPALIFFILGIVATYVGLYATLLQVDFLRPSIGAMVIGAVINLVLIIIGVFAYTFVGSQLFKGKGTFGELFKVLGYGYLIVVLSIIPVLGWIAAIWYLVITYKALETIKKLNVGNNILTIIITVVVVAIVGGVLNSIFALNSASIVNVDFSSYF